MESQLTVIAYLLVAITILLALILWLQFNRYFGLHAERLSLTIDTMASDLQDIQSRLRERFPSDRETSAELQ
jgi:hypothetical protein